MHMMYTKCPSCRKWDNCARCGACHTCRPDVRDLCVAVRLVDEAQNGQKQQATRKRQSTPYAPGMGQNGTKPRASHPMRNWYKPVIEAEKHPMPVSVRKTDPVPARDRHPGTVYTETW